MSSSSKRLRINSPKISNTANAGARSTSDVPASLTTRSVPSQDGNSNTGRSVLTDDILPLILDNLGILTPKDLLNFRLVNRCWRNAATAVLLQQNACSIALKIGEVGLDADVNPKSYEELLSVNPNFERSERRPPIYKFYSARPPHSLLPALTKLISASPAFPSNSIKFLPGCEKALRNQPMRLPNEFYLLEEDELTRLFSLYGQTIKKLSWSSKISSYTVEKLLFIYLPNVHCLDLTNCFRFEARQFKQNRVFHFKKKAKKNPNLTLPKLLKVHSGRESELPWCKGNFLEELVYISPNLDAVLDAGFGALSVLVNMGRAELIKSLYYNPSSSHQLASLLEEPLRQELRSLKLTQLTVMLSQISGKKNVYQDVTRVLNIIFRKSKDTLKYLELHVNPKYFVKNIRIPPLGNLKCLKLVREHSVFGNPLGRVIKTARASSNYGRSKWRAAAAAEENVRPVDRCAYDLQVFKFERKQTSSRNGIPAGYFPALSKVLLHVEADSMNTWDKILAFFALEHTDGTHNGLSIVSGDILPNVSTLELTAFPEVDKKLGKLFPNLRHLKIKCDPLSELRNWVWRAFPKLEKFYIYNYIPAKDKAVADNFFSGFSHELCTTFSANVAHTDVILDLSPEEILCLRTEPYIGECGNLRELTVQFREKLSSMFVSKLTDLFAFQDMIHQTKIVFSFKSIDLGVDEITEIRKHLQPVASHIEILL